MSPLSRWWLRRRHRGGEWAALLQPPPAGEWVSLDLETTGMDPARDHILSLAAVPVRAFLHWLGSRRLLGYNLGFDLDMLGPHVRAATGFALPNATVDLADDVARRQRQQRPNAPVNLDFAHIADTLGVPMVERHSALGDATTVGLCWLALQARGWPAE